MPPNIVELMQRVRRLRMVTAHHVSERFGGEYRSVFKGQGMEFDEVREYAYGDDVRGIDWNVTARTGVPHLKRYREERELTIMLLVDVSASGQFGSRARSKVETAAELACLLAFTADRSHDKIGLVLFSDRIVKAIPPAGGRQNVMRVLREILAAEATGKGTDIGMALRFVNRVRKRRTVVFLISDFLCEKYEHDLLLCAARHDLVACRICDVAERRLPPRGLLLETIDPESGVMRLIDTTSRAGRRRLQQWIEEQDQRLKNLCRRHRIDLMELSNEQSVCDAVQALFRRRQRRLRGGFALR